jgi:hypothetical protein
MSYIAKKAYIENWYNKNTLYGLILLSTVFGIWGAWLEFDYGNIRHPIFTLLTSVLWSVLVIYPLILRLNKKYTNKENSNKNLSKYKYYVITERILAVILLVTVGIGGTLTAIINAHPTYQILNGILALVFSSSHLIFCFFSRLLIK